MATILIINKYRVRFNYNNQKAIPYINHSGSKKVFSNIMQWNLWFNNL